MGVQRKMSFDDEDIHFASLFLGAGIHNKAAKWSVHSGWLLFIFDSLLSFFWEGFQYCISQKGCQNQSTKPKDFHFSCSNRLGLFRVARFLEITLDLGSSCCLAFQIEEYLGHKNLGRNPNFGDVGKNLSS